MDMNFRMPRCILTVSYTHLNIKTKDFRWTTAFNLRHNKNKTLKLADLPWFVDGRYVRKEAYPFNTIYPVSYTHLVSCIGASESKIS